MQAILRLLRQHPLTLYKPALIAIKPFILKQNIVETTACFRYAGELFRLVNDSITA